jgi:hypothetical protein
MASGVNSTATVTRPNDTTPYSAGDVVGGLITFPNFGSGYSSYLMLTSTQFRWDVSAIPSGATSFALQLYSASPATPLADNAPWDLVSADRGIYLGSISLGSPVDLGSTCYVEQNIINKEIRLSGDTLYAYCVTATGYTPAAQVVQFFNLLAVGLW